jgi:CBS domain-containing protein
MPTLKEIMTSEVFVTSSSAPVADVAASMLRGRFGSAVVMEGSM